MSHGQSLPRIARSPWAVVAVLALSYGLWLARVLPHSHGGWAFIEVSRGAISRSTASAAIAEQQRVGYFPRQHGFDGEWYFFIALDPAGARHYLDNPPYRYTRILYPLLARGIALGRPWLIPYALIAINYVAVCGGTLAVGWWLRRKRTSPWFALLFGFSPGLLISLKDDLADAPAVCLVALAVYLLEFGGRGRLAWAGLTFALATLAKETSTIFALVYAGHLALQTRRGRPGGPAAGSGHRTWPLFALLAVGPIIVYWAFLTHWLGFAGVAANMPRATPFDGLLARYPWDAEVVEGVRSVVFPSLLCGGVGLWALARDPWRVEIWALLVNIVLFVVLLSPASYGSIYDLGRIASGVILSALLCLPYMDGLLRGNRWWLWASGALWLSLTPFLLLFPQWHR